MVQRDRIGLALCGLTIVVAVLMVGGAPRWAQAITAACAAATLVTTLTSRRSFNATPPLVALFAVSAGWSLLQWMPLPATVVESLSPAIATLRADGATLAGIDIADRLSADASGTLRGTIFLITLSAVAVAALRLSITERGRVVLVSCVAGTAGVAALVTALHELLGAQDLYGLYTPQQGRPFLMGPLLNTNHLGSLMAVGAVTSTGLFLHRKQASFRRLLWAVVALACIAVAVATYSRGAIIGMALGLLVTVVLLLAQRMRSLADRSEGRRERFLVTTVPLGITLLCVLVVAVYLGAGSVMQQLEKTSLAEVHAPTSKFMAWRSSMILLEEAPWVGVGRGAFEPAFTRAHPASAFATFASLENIPLQALIEWGIPATLVLAALLVWLLLRALRRWHDGAVAAGALGALVSVMFQSNFDFGLELLGLAVPVTVLVATLSYGSLSEAPPHRRRLNRGLRVAHVAVVLAGTTLLFTAMTRTVGESHQVLRDSPDDAEVLASIEQHPLDYFGFAVLAQQQLRAGDARGIAALNHALRLHPTHAGLHRLAARMLLSTRHVDQAQAEYTTAIRYTLHPSALLLEVAAAFDSTSAAGALPLDLDIDRTIKVLHDAGHTEIALLWLERVTTYKADLHATESLYALAMQGKNYAAAERAMRRRCELLPGTRCQLELARVLSLLSKHAQVTTVLEDVATWQGRTDEKLAAWLLLCDTFVALRDVSKAKECLRRLDVSGLVPTDSDDVRRRREAIDASLSAGGIN